MNLHRRLVIDRRCAIHRFCSAGQQRQEDLDLPHRQTAELRLLPAGTATAAAVGSPRSIRRSEGPGTRRRRPTGRRNVPASPVQRPNDCLRTRRDQVSTPSPEPQHRRLFLRRAVGTEHHDRHSPKPRLAGGGFRLRGSSISSPDTASMTSTRPLIASAGRRTWCDVVIRRDETKGPSWSAEQGPRATAHSDR